MSFQKTIWEYYHTQGRKLPWRETANPYHIVVSEIMLQQTQVPRVIPKYNDFISTFPTFEDLAKATFAQVLSSWSGLGYNRRAKYLQAIAQKVVSDFQGVLPQDPRILETFPGIGAATARAIVVYAFGIPQVFIETNIRRVFLHFFFPNQESVSDKELLPLIEKHLDTQQPRKWYWALMDYGTYLALSSNANKRSRHYTKQSKFEGSIRQVRGEILRVLLKKGSVTEEELLTFLHHDHRIALALEGLRKDKLITLTGTTISLVK